MRLVFRFTGPACHPAAARVCSDWYHHSQLKGLVGGWWSDMTGGDQSLMQAQGGAGSSGVSGSPLSAISSGRLIRHLMQMEHQRGVHNGAV
jgi:hypothetical protein